jgi:lysozyme
MGASALYGPDVSNYQGSGIDWGAVAASGATFAIAKASEGVGFTDPTFARNWPAIKGHGLIRGAYHFGRPDLGLGGAAEARHFMSVVGPLAPGDFVVLDIEVGTGNLSAYALEFLETVTAIVAPTDPAFTPWLYTGGWFAAGRLTDAQLGNHPLWNAAYTAQMPAAYAPWPLVSMWQYTDHAPYPGISTPCDSSYFQGTRDQLLTLCVAAPGPAHPQTPPRAPDVPPGPTGKTYVVSGGKDDFFMYLRVTPRLQAPFGARVSQGAVLHAEAAPDGLPSWTTNWRYVRTDGGAVGYAYASNLALH